MFSKVLIANRGEIAVRIARTCRELGVETVAVFSDVDERARHVEIADEAVHLPGVVPADTYLNSAAIIDAALTAGAEAIHPGYGFLSERSSFASAVIDAGLAWVGPPPSVLDAVGDKISARRIALAAGVPVVPGLTDPVADASLVKDFAAEHGFPVAIKAAGGGGGRGLKVARREEELVEAFDSARREAEAYFGDDAVYVERYLDNPKHLEVQILGLSPDEALWLGVRDCSLQRRHQKLIEETPPPREYASMSADMGRSAVALAKECGYINAGTAEFLADPDGGFYFLEVNARLQVEHTVTEEVFGLDLVACQLAIAAGEDIGISQDDLVARGHAIECRINAEDPSRGFVPTPGTISTLKLPDGLGVRVDSGFAAGDEVPAAYDSLLAKLITWGSDRNEARARMLRALDEMTVEGVRTTIPAHKVLLNDQSFVAGSHHTRSIEDDGILDDLVVEAAPEAEGNVLIVQGRPVRLWNPGMAASASAAVHGAVSDEDLIAPMQGTILSVLIEPGQKVETGQPAFVLEAMKMETTIAVARAGTVVELRVAPGDGAAAGQLLAVIE